MTDIDPEAREILDTVKALLVKHGETDPTDSTAIIWMADAINTYVDKIHELKNSKQIFNAF